MRQQVQSIATSKASPDAVWAIAGDFCTPWHPAIASMQAENDGGLVRRFEVLDDTATYRERLTFLSHSDRTYAYTHVSGIKGVHRYDGRLTVTPGEAEGSVITMSATLSAPADRAEEIAEGTKLLFDDGVASLAILAETTNPAALPEPTPTASPVETITIDDTPRLTLSVTPARPGLLCLFLHGIGGARTNWAPQLSRAGGIIRAAAMDLRGYGDSTMGAEQTTVDDYCEDILRVRQALGADKLFLCGLSYGSWIATSFAMRHPDLLAGLVLSGGCTGMSEAGPEEREAFRLSRETPLDAGQSPADFAPSVVNAIAGPDAGDEARADLLASMSAIPAATYRDALTCFTNPLERFDFSKLTMPVLLMTGEHDRLAPPVEIRAVAGRICDQSSHPDVQFETIAGAGHVCNLEAPAAYNQHLLRFLRRVA